MQNQSALPSLATPPQPQSVAALLPAEILDLVFAQLGLNYSMKASVTDRSERCSNLSSMSVIAEGWTKPARRLLFRTVQVRSWTHLQELVKESVGKEVRELDIYAPDGVELQKVAGAVFKLLKRLPNLRRLRLFSIRFNSFNTLDSTTMQSTVLLPQLDDLVLSGSCSPHSIIFDLLATSNHSISRLNVYLYTSSGPTVSPIPQLDFHGKLRFLATQGGFYRELVERAALGGMKGLTELQLLGATALHSNRESDFHQIIAPTLRTLTIRDADLTPFAAFLPLLPHLSRLSLPNPYANPATLLQCLPPSLSVLRLADDRSLQPNLARWTANPSLVPAGLKQIQIDLISTFETYRQLPPIQTLSANYRSYTLEYLERLSPGTLPFKTLEMRFDDYFFDRRSLVEAECPRLGVEFRQRLEFWDT